VTLQPDIQQAPTAATTDIALVPTQLWQQDKAYATLLGSVLEDMRVYRYVLLHQHSNILSSVHARDTASAIAR
jgi:hypothetical protein